jgi:putative transposase
VKVTSLNNDSGKYPRFWSGIYRDITYLPTSVKGLFSYLYMVMDIYSRKIVGWQVYELESSALAADLMIDICQREGVQ